MGRLFDLAVRTDPIVEAEEYVPVAYELFRARAAMLGTMVAKLLP